MGITGGFGTTIDLDRGASRQWVMGRDGVKRWADNGDPVQMRPDYDEMELALKVIYTWAGVDGALVPKHVRTLAGKALLMTPNDRVEGRDAALSRRVPSHDGLEGNGTGHHE